jgi:hypothetical protein
MEIHRKKEGKAGFPLIATVEPVMFGVLRVVFDDGYEGILDLRSDMGRGIWQNIRTREDFFEVELDQFGSDLSWPKGGGVTELPADGVRLTCERQESLLKSMR